MNRANDILDRISALKAKGEPFALATVVRTVSVTAAKAGAKAIILPDGSVSEGWIGGGCARAAVLKAAREALADGKARFVSVEPPDVLQEKGIAAGEEKEGVRFVKNMCPSQGTMDIFVEPVLPRPEIVDLRVEPGRGRACRAGAAVGFPDHRLRAAGRAAGVRGNRPPHRRLRAARREGGRALRRRLDAGPRRRGGAEGRASGRGRLRRLRRQQAEGSIASRQASADGVAEARLDRLKAPAGLDLGAITPEEIALSICRRSWRSTARDSARWRVARAELARALSEERLQRLVELAELGIAAVVDRGVRRDRASASRRGARASRHRASPSPRPTPSPQPRPRRPRSRAHSQAP